MSYKINICNKFDVQKFSDAVLPLQQIKASISHPRIKVTVTDVI